MEDLVKNMNWEDRVVLVTGHTGFKGSWLSIYLSHLGAKVHGYALDPKTDLNLFELAGVSDFLSSDTRKDINDLEVFKKTVREIQPKVVFHLAAQSLVTEGYEKPVETWGTNLLGTVNVLEACRLSNSVEAVVVVTTDKVYEPTDYISRFVESDRIGGVDPYSASKSAVEFAVSSYKRSFPRNASSRVLNYSTARAGNVIGGGDWSSNRLMPDCLRAVSAEMPLILRNPSSIRPWQHVLDPLFGYISLADRMRESDGFEFSSSWNFGPSQSSLVTVNEVVSRFCEMWGTSIEILDISGTEKLLETEVLQLDSSKCYDFLGWKSKWDLDKAIEATVQWHKSLEAGKAMNEVCLNQIDDF